MISGPLYGLCHELFDHNVRFLKRDQPIFINISATIFSLPFIELLKDQPKDRGDFLFSRRRPTSLTIGQNFFKIKNSTTLTPTPTPFITL